MSVALYMDEHVPRAITAGLRIRGVDVVTAQEDDRRHIADAVLLARATDLQRVLFSQDEDLLAEATRCQEQGISFAGVVYAHQLRITIGMCVQDLELIAKAAEPEELANRVEYLPL
jgi:predicted nuclease of predicted toxin-antitoxin system